VQFEFATSSRIVFGPGAASKIDAVAAEFGSRPLLVTGVRGATGTSFVVPGEPTVDLVREGTALCRASHADVVIAIGGGSVIDAAKAIAALVPNSGEPLDYLEVVGRGLPLQHPSLPVVAAPTTAGTGTEVTRNAVLASTEHRVKASLRSPHMLPRAAVIDPMLTLDLPPAITASTGLDALTQLIEPYLSVRANAMTDLFCLEGMKRVARSLRRAFANGHDTEARIDMSFAALLGGLSLANAGLGVVHGHAAPVGGMFDAPHGAVCAALLPHGLEVNLRACRERSPGLLDRFAVIARVLTERPDAGPEDAVTSVRELCDDLRIPGLRQYGVREADLPEISARAAKASSMKANPVPLNPEEILEVVSRAW
jgi:alcohol dehydrogenase class IV